MDDIDLIGWLLISACIVIVALPPKYDPAVRFREWTGRRNGRK